MTVTKWLLGISGVAGLVWLALTFKDVGSPSPPPDNVTPPSAVRPSTSSNEPLTVAELLWCMSEEARLQAMQPRLATLEAVDRHNRIAEDVNNRCAGRVSSDEVLEAAMAEIASLRDSIHAAAIQEIEPLNDVVPGAINRAQELLSMLGYEPGAVDGVYGAQTKSAIQAFQADDGLPADGLISEQLLDRIDVALVRNRTNRTRRVVVEVYVTEANTDVPIAGADVTITNDQGQRAGVTDDTGRTEFISVQPGTLDVRVRRDDVGAAFQAAITQDPRQEVLIVMPEVIIEDELQREGQ